MIVLLLEWIDGRERNDHHEPHNHAAHATTPPIISVT
jgi:hypothetical protein